MARILVCDDTVDNAKAIQSMLQFCVPEHQVDVVYSGAECLTAYTFAKYHNQAYDLIILDVAMPFMNGFEVEAKIWGMGDTCTRVAFLTAMADELKVERESYSRVVGVWEKPLAQAELCELVNAALHHHLPTDLKQWVQPQHRRQVRHVGMD